MSNGHFVPPVRKAPQRILDADGNLVEPRARPQLVLPGQMDPLDLIVAGIRMRCRDQSDAGVLRAMAQDLSMQFQSIKGLMAIANHQGTLIARAGQIFGKLDGPEGPTNVEEATAVLATLEAWRKDVTELKEFCQKAMPQTAPLAAPVTPPAAPPATGA